MAEHSRRTFGPVVLLGLAGGGLAALSGARDAVGVDGAGPASIALAQLRAGDGLTLPVVTSLGLVVLASWGVLLVTRGVVRRLVAVLATVAAAGALAAGLAGFGGLRERVEDTLTRAGEAGGAGPTAWYVLGLLGAAVAVAAGAAAVRLVPAWPEMGRRYDTPAGAGGSATATSRAADEHPADLWTAIGEGRDPTRDQTRD